MALTPSMVPKPEIYHLPSTTHQHHHNAYQLLINEESNPGRIKSFI